MEIDYERCADLLGSKEKWVGIFLEKSNLPGYGNNESFNIPGLYVVRCSLEELKLLDLNVYPKTIFFNQGVEFTQVKGIVDLKKIKRFLR